MKSGVTRAVAPLLSACSMERIPASTENACQLRGDVIRSTCDTILYHSGQGVLFLSFGKNAFSIFAFPVWSQRIVSQQAEVRFSVRSLRLGLRTFYFPKRRGNDKKRKRGKGKCLKNAEKRFKKLRMCF